MAKLIVTPQTRVTKPSHEISDEASNALPPGGNQPGAQAKGEANVNMMSAINAANATSVAHERPTSFCAMMNWPGTPKLPDSHVAWEEAVRSEMEARAELDAEDAQSMAPANAAHKAGKITFAGMEQAEKRFAHYADAHLDAVRKLSVCPAPSLAAVLYKLEVAESIETFDGEAQDIASSVIFDLKRFISETSTVPPAPRSERGDVAIIEAWDRYREAYACYAALPDGKPHEYVNGETAAERAQGAIIDEARERVTSSTAASLRGVEIQLWMAMAGQLLTWGKDCAAARREDLAYLSTPEAECREDDAILAAIRSLRAMGADVATTQSQVSDSAFEEVLQGFLTARHQLDYAPSSISGEEEDRLGDIYMRHFAAMNAVRPQTERELGQKFLMLWGKEGYPADETIKELLADAARILRMPEAV